MEIPTDRGLTMTCYTAGPGTASEQNLKLLASWAATLEQDAARVDTSGRQLGYLRGLAAGRRVRGLRDLVVWLWLAGSPPAASPGSVAVFQ